MLSRSRGGHRQRERCRCQSRVIGHRPRCAPRRLSLSPCGTLPPNQKPDRGSPVIGLRARPRNCSKPLPRKDLRLIRRNLLDKDSREKREFGPLWSGLPRRCAESGAKNFDRVDTDPAWINAARYAHPTHSTWQPNWPPLAGLPSWEGCSRASAKGFQGILGPEPRDSARNVVTSYTSCRF